MSSGNHGFCAINRPLVLLQVDRLDSKKYFSHCQLLAILTLFTKINIQLQGFGKIEGSLERSFMNKELALFK